MRCRRRDTGSVGKRDALAPTLPLPDWVGGIFFTPHSSDMNKTKKRAHKRSLERVKSSVTSQSSRMHELRQRLSDIRARRERTRQSSLETIPLF